MNEKLFNYINVIIDLLVSAMLFVTFGRVYESLDDGGAGKFGSLPVVSCTGGSGLAGGTAWNWGA